MQRIPSVASTGWTTSLPLGGFNAAPFDVVSDESASSRTQPVAQLSLVSPGYFRTLGVRIVAGRGFTEQDTASSPPVCIVSEAVVRRHLGGRNPIGMRVSVRQINIGPVRSVVREIVGVAADVRLNLYEVEEARSMYVPITQNPWSFAALVVRPSAGTAQALVPPVRAAFTRIDRRVPLAQARTLDELMRLVTSRPRFRAVLVTTFAVLALLLAVIGVGAVVGLMSAAIFARSIATFLFGVRPLDPTTFSAVIVLIIVTAAIAAAIPALRASRVDPTIALRND